MKNFLLFITIIFMYSSSVHAVNEGNWQKKLSQKSEFKDLTPGLSGITFKEFMEMTPLKYKSLTGNKLGLKNSVKLRVAQKYLSQLKEDPNKTDITKTVYILAAVFGLGWLCMGLLDDWEGSDWLINILLTAACWLPGLIHALIKIKKYYK